jgi:tRNA(Ile)-lysidine synthase
MKIGNLPTDCYLAFSGGSDSSMALHFLTRNPLRKIKLLYIAYDDFEHTEKELSFVRNKANEYNLELVVKNIPSQPIDCKRSKEEYWSYERNMIFQKQMDKPVIVVHTLDDALEWYLMTTFKTLNGKLIPPVNGNVVRPFILVLRSEVYDYLSRYNIEYFNDPTNQDSTFCLRNHIRHNLVNDILKVNPGIYKTLTKMYNREMNRSL